MNRIPAADIIRKHSIETRLKKMSELRSGNTSELSMGCAPVALVGPEKASVSILLSRLAFDWPGLRIGLELSLLVTFHALFYHFALLSGAIDKTNHVVPLLLWFATCVLALFFDQFVLCRPVFIFRRAYHLALSGSWDEALHLLSTISPESPALIHCPPAMYHLRRAEILIEAGMYRTAERELQLAEGCGTSQDRLSVLRSRLIRFETENGLSRAQEELKSAVTRSGETALLCLEEGLLLLEARKDLWSAKRILKRASEMPEEIHLSGERTSLLARAACAATRLWTGEAEEGLVELTMAINRLLPMAGSLDTIRPILAFLLLERSHYLATHKEPDAAAKDLRVGLTLCSYPSLTKKAELIREELSWRHGLTAELVA